MRNQPQPWSERGQGAAREAALHLCGAGPASGFLNRQTPGSHEVVLRGGRWVCGAGGWCPPCCPWGHKPGARAGGQGRWGALGQVPRLGLSVSPPSPSLRGSPWSSGARPHQQRSPRATGSVPWETHQTCTCRGSFVPDASFHPEMLLDQARWTWRQAWWGGCGGSTDRLLLSPSSCGEREAEARDAKK